MARQLVPDARVAARHQDGLIGRGGVVEVSLSTLLEVLAPISDPQSPKITLCVVSFSLCPWGLPPIDKLGISYKIYMGSMS